MSHSTRTVLRGHEPSNSGIKHRIDGEKLDFDCMWAVLNDCVAKAKRSVCCPSISKYVRTDRTARRGKRTRRASTTFTMAQEHPRLRFAPILEFTALSSWTWHCSSRAITEALSIEAVVLFYGLGHVPRARHSLACEGARGLDSKFSCKQNNSVFLLHWVPLGKQPCLPP